VKSQCTELLHTLYIIFDRVWVLETKQETKQETTQETKETKQETKQERSRGQSRR
jgi:hypothetical protein